MAIVFNGNSLLTQFVWLTGNFASGGGTTTLGWNVNFVDGSDVVGLVEQIAAAADEHLQPVVDSDVSLSRIDWSTAGFSGSVAGFGPGGANRQSPPPNVTMLMSYRSIEKGPRTRGRSYWPGMAPSEDNVDERGQVQEAYRVSLLGALADFFEAAAEGPDIVQSVPQSEPRPGGSPPILPWPLVTQRSLSPLVASQRRRLRR